MMVVGVLCYCLLLILVCVDFVMLDTSVIAYSVVMIYVCVVCIAVAFHLIWFRRFG